MTASQKNEILRLRDNGVSYTNIADELDLSVNTVQSFCRRQTLAENKIIDTRPKCCHCKKPMKPSGQKTRRFCSDACRMAWWAKHPEKRTCSNTSVCAFCGDEFDHIGNRPRKYCSRGCYGKSKAGARIPGVAS